MVVLTPYIHERKYTIILFWMLQNFRQMKNEKWMTVKKA